MGYLKENRRVEEQINNHSLIIPADYKQIFKNPFSLNVGRNEIVKMKKDNVLNDLDLEFTKFLFQFNFATAKQISRSISSQNGEDVKNVESKLEKLVRHRVINKFALKRLDDGLIPSDALMIYCLDFGGRYLLANYSNVDTTDWVSTVNMKSSELISKSILTTEFYLRLKETVGDRLVHFKPLPERQVNRVNVVPSFDFSVKSGLQTVCFIGEVVRGYDFPQTFMEKAEKLEQLLMTNAWKKYYYFSDQEPVLLVFGDTDVTAIQAAKLIENATEIKRVRYSTDERLQRELSDLGAFMRYLPEEDLLQEVISRVFQKPN